MESMDRTLEAICDLMDETDADSIVWKITTIEGKVITISVKHGGALDD